MKTEAEILAAAVEAARNGDVSAALGEIVKGMALQSEAGGTLGFPAGLPRVDAFCQKLGRQLLGQIKTQQRDVQPLDVYLVSEIYAIGGHTALIGDYVAYRPGRQARLLVSNYRNREEPAPLAAIARTRIAPEAVEICPVPDPVGKARWLLERLAGLRPERLFLIHHPEDSSAVAAAQPALARWIYFVHHADHSPALGVHLPCAGHLDVTPRTVHCCRDLLGVERAVYLPLSCAEPAGERHARTRLDQAILTTATSGRLGKFSFKGPNSYVDIITHLLAATTVRHVHIGPLPPAVIESWPQVLAARGIAPERLVHVPHVESVWQAMIDFEVDIYLSSFPEGGARVSVEVMGSGTPVLLHAGSKNPQRCSLNLVYPEAAWWDTSEELVLRIQEADTHWLARHQSFARRHFERFHAASLIAPLFVNDPIVGVPAIPLAEAALSPQRSLIAAYRQKILRPRNP